MDLSNVDPGHLDEPCRRYGAARIDVIGSVARDEYRERSDIDLLYELRSGARLGWDIETLRTSWRTCSAARWTGCPVERCIRDCGTASSPRPGPRMRVGIGEPGDQVAHLDVEIGEA